MKLPDRDEAQRIWRRHRHGSLRQRALLILKLSERAGQSQRSLATEIGVSPRTVGRWIKIIEESGFRDLLIPSSNGNRLTDSECDELCAGLASGSIRSMRHAAEEAFHRFGRRYTAEGMRKRIARHREVVRRYVSPGARPLNPRLAGATGLMAPETVEFLNSLPREVRLEDWVRRFRHALIRLLPGAERVMLSVASRVDRGRRNNTRGSVFVRTDVVDEPDRQPTDSTGESSILVVDKRFTDRTTQILSRMARSGIDLDRYEPPVELSLATDEGGHLAVILVLIKKGSPESAEFAGCVLRDLEPFLKFCVTDALMRTERETALEVVVRDRIDTVSDAADLSPRQREVLALHCYGLSYREIADQLDISLGTVRSHITAIHRALNVKSRKELMFLLLE